MIHSVRFKAVLDTNVLFPMVQRDILLWFAYFDLYTPVWSMHILAEFEKVVREKYPNLTESQIRKIVDLPGKAFPFASVRNYESIIDTIELNDPNDRHILAVAIKSNSDVIVTNNLKDFPRKYLQTFEIESKHPDDFLCDIIDIDHLRASEAFHEMVLNKRKPDLNEFEVLDMLRKNNLKNSADFLHSLYSIQNQWIRNFFKNP